ncbi:MAG: FHA domain-containing protein, partial [Gallionellaceae bacterium]|nr:FHA domain-containing protein [Gallionellaceae bacterium]
TVQNDSFIEDLDSTNGILVNGVAIQKHFLRNNDVIEIGKYKLKYLNEQQSQTAAADFEKTVVLSSPPRTAAKPAIPDPTHEATGKIRAMTPPQSRPATPAPVIPPPQAMVPPQPVITPAPAAAAVSQAGATIQILTGPNAGKELELVKNLTTLGKPGLQVAVLTRRPHGYFITYVEGAHYPTLNGKPLDDQPRQLKEHDIIELAGIKMEFYFKN